MPDKLFPIRNYSSYRETLRIAVFIPLLFCLFYTQPRGADAANVFPRYPEINDEVRFWELIYSTHSINSAVIHDRNDLSKVYAIIKLQETGLPGADKFNRNALKTATKKYQIILKKLSSGKKPGTSSEKQVAALFTGADARKRMARAADNIRTQTGQKERFIQGVTRSGAYIGKIRRILAKNGLPADIAYLPHVESSYNTEAYSKFGAAGMWQFTRSTGKQYLTIDDAVDERRDPFLAADAAAKYLKNSYRLLGNWPLALTAYNYGTSGMMRAQKAKGSYVKIHEEYNEGHFGFASRNFYSEFLAAVQVAKRLEKSPSIKKDPEFTFREYVLPGYIHIKDIKRHFKLTTNTIKKYNPALRSPVYSGKKLLPRGYSLRLPIQSNISARISTFPKSYLRTSQIKDKFYRVQRGDTAGGIAAKHRVHLKDLIRLNHLDTSASIYVGQRLRLPSSRLGKKQKLPPYIGADRAKTFPESRTHITHQKEHPTPVFKDGKKKRPSSMLIAREGVVNDVITVQPDESLSLYALWLQVKEETIRKKNKLSSSDPIDFGQKIRIDYDKVSAARFAELRTDFARETEDEFFSVYRIVGKNTYTVQPGDTLWELCVNKFSIPLWLLHKYNSSIDLTRIHPKQKLTIPVVKKN